jgi:DNA-binding IclR family transcriptional regulator
MARPAPSAERTVALLDFLAAHPDERFGLSELARRLGISKATAHALTAALTECGYLLRHPVEKRYSLGPALVAIGNAAASRQFEVVDYARDEMRRLADELHVMCVASATMGDEIVILARSGDLGPLAPSVQVGHRLPLAPPLGTVFMAWSGPDAIDAWLRRLGPAATDVEVERYRAAVATVRHRGCSLALEADARIRLGEALGGADEQVGALVEELGHEEYILGELEQSSSYRLSLIAAPVFSAERSIAAVLTLFGFRDALPAREVPRLAERLLQSTHRVTKALHGRAPDAAGS